LMAANPTSKTSSAASSASNAVSNSAKAEVATGNPPHAPARRGPTRRSCGPAPMKTGAGRTACPRWGRLRPARRALAPAATTGTAPARPRSRPAVHGRATAGPGARRPNPCPPWRGAPLPAARPPTAANFVTVFYQLRERNPGLTKGQTIKRADFDRETGDLDREALRPVWGVPPEMERRGSGEQARRQARPRPSWNPCLKNSAHGWTSKSAGLWRRESAIDPSAAS
jgi:hypothetical protein